MRKRRSPPAPPFWGIAAEWTTTFNSSERIDQDMPFAAGDLLGRIKALRVKVAWILEPSATELYVNRICTSLPSSLRIA
jgi:hypothetical protein